MANGGDDVPSYRDLTERTDAPPGSSWGVFGDTDQLGTINRLTPATVVAAASLVRTGKVFNLDYPLNTFVPSLAGTRPATSHNMFANNPNHRDDWLDSFYLQSTSQIDGLRHIRDPRHGFYGGVPDEAITEGSPDLGIQLLAEAGVVGRGVLIDIPRHFATVGRDYDISSLVPIGPDDLDRAAAAQGVEVGTGDMLLLRFGWADYYLGLPVEDRPIGTVRTGTPGLEQSDRMLEWLWDTGLALVAADNGGLEAFPRDPGHPWVDPTEPPPPRGPSHNGMLHRPLIALLGMWIGELWRLEELAADCAEDGVYEFLLVAKPLNVVGGVGSPPNATAIK